MAAVEASAAQPEVGLFRILQLSQHRPPVGPAGPEQEHGGGGETGWALPAHQCVLAPTPAAIRTTTLPGAEQMAYLIQVQVDSGSRGQSAWPQSRGAHRIQSPGGAERGLPPDRA